MNTQTHEKDKGKIYKSNPKATHTMSCVCVHVSFTAARKANKSPPKAPKVPVPTSPSSHLPQVLHHLTLTSPTSDSLQTAQPSMSSSALHRHMCTNTVQETENTYMYVDLDSSTESDTEEVPTTSLRQRIPAKNLTLCSASRDQLIQTSLSTAQSVCKASQRSNSPSQCDVWARVSTSDEQPTSESHYCQGFIELGREDRFVEKCSPWDCGLCFLQMIFTL